MNHKTIFITVTIIVLAILAFMIFLSKNNTNPPVGLAPALPTEKSIQPTNTNLPLSKDEPTKTNTQVVSDWKKYKNDLYGFALTFPDSWQGYSVTNRTLNWGDFGTSDSLDFGFPAQPDGLFNISIHTKEQWKQITGEEGPKPSFLGETKTHVFAWSQAQYTANSEVEKRMKDIKDIIKTFRVQ